MGCCCRARREVILTAGGMKLHCKGVVNRGVCTVWGRQEQWLAEMIAKEYGHDNSDVSCDS